MKLHLSRGETYIPKWNGNDKAEAPVRFKLHYLTPDEREQCDTIYVPVGESRRGVKVKTDYRQAFMLGVEAIENLTIEIDGADVEIKTAADFLKYAMPQELYLEVALRVKETSGVELKN